MTIDEKPYPSWEEVYLFLKNRGFRFTCDITSQNNKPMMLVRFFSYHGDNMAEATAELLDEQFDENLVYEAVGLDLYIDQLPEWYPIVRDDFEDLLGNLQTFLEDVDTTSTNLAASSDDSGEDAALANLSRRAMTLLEQLKKVWGSDYDAAQ